jgi:hypothetical protein
MVDARVEAVLAFGVELATVFLLALRLFDRRRRKRRGVDARKPDVRLLDRCRHVLLHEREKRRLVEAGRVERQGIERAVQRTRRNGSLDGRKGELFRVDPGKELRVGFLRWLGWLFSRCAPRTDPAASLAPVSGDVHGSESSPPEPSRILHAGMTSAPNEASSPSTRSRRSFDFPNRKALPGSLRTMPPRSRRFATSAARTLPCYVGQALLRKRRRIFAHGLSKVALPSCRPESLVGISCKRRGTCPKLRGEDPVRRLPKVVAKSQAQDYYRK